MRRAKASRKTISKIMKRRIIKQELIVNCAFISASVLLLIKLIHSFNQLASKKRECNLAHQQIQSCSQRNEYMIDKITNFENDVDLLETSIRSRLRLIKPNEIIVVM